MRLISAEEEGRWAYNWDLTVLWGAYKRRGANNRNILFVEMEMVL